MSGLSKDWLKRLQREHEPLLGMSVTLLLMLGAYLWRLYLLRMRFFDPDEFQHLHAAWYVSKGWLPYRDFFEHHTPGIYFFFAPLYAFFNVETNVEQAHAFLFFARTWMWLLAGAILVLTGWLGALWRKTWVGWIAALLLSNTLMFVEKTLEVRPDGFSLTLWVACVALTVRGLRDSGPASTPAFVWSGALLGAAVMFTQKMLFALPGFAVAMLWYLCDRRSRGTPRQRFRNLSYQLLGFLAPILLTCGYFVLRSGLSDFIEYNFLLNARWGPPLSPLYFFMHLVAQNPIYVSLAGVGFLRAFVGMFQGDGYRRAEFVAVLSAVSLAVGLFIMPTPFRQYYLMLLPLGAVFAAGLLIDAVDGIAAACRGVWPKDALSSLYVLAESAMFIILLVFALRVSRPRVLTDHFYAAMWVVGFVAAAVSLLRWKKHLATSILLVALSVYPIQQMRNVIPSPEWRNTETLNHIRYVLEHTSPTESVMDGWTGLGVFRPHAWFYWFLHREVQAMLSEQIKVNLRTNLVAGTVAPKLILFDEDLQNLSAETTQFFIEHYVPTGTGVIWKRK